MNVSLSIPAKRSRKPIHSFLFIILAGLLTSCSTLTLTYNYADWLLFWRIDHYFDVSAYQKPVLETHLTQLHSWHREQEIPRYVAFLQMIHRHWQDGLTQPELDEIFDRYDILRDRLGSRVASECVEFLTTVNPRQVEHLETVMQTENQELLFDIGADSDTRTAKRVERALGWLRFWLGDLSSAQKRRFTQVIEQYPDTTDQWLEYRVYRQQQFTTLLKSGADKQTLENQVHDWLVTPEKDAPLSYAEVSKHRKQHLKVGILAIDRMVTPDQRRYASRRLRNLIEEFQQMGMP